MANKLTHGGDTNPKSRRGVGIYSFEQTKYATPVQYAGVIVFGGVTSLIGIALGLDEIARHRQELVRCGHAQWDLERIFVSLVAFLLGVFFAHAGVIHFGRKIIDAISKSPHERHSHPHRF